MNNLLLKKNVFTLMFGMVALVFPLLVGATDHGVGPQFIQDRSAQACGEKPGKTCVTQSQVDDCRAEFELEYTKQLNQHCKPPQGAYEYSCSDEAMAKLDAFLEVFKGYAIYQKVFLTQCENEVTYKPQKDFYKLICGNGIVTGVEECDDSNLQDGDGCSAQCKIEVPAKVDADDPIAADPKSDIPAVGAQDPLVKTPTNAGSFGQPAFAINGGACSLQVSDSSPAVFPYAFVAMSIALALWNRRVKR